MFVCRTFTAAQTRFRVQLDINSSNPKSESKKRELVGNAHIPTSSIMCQMLSVLSEHIRLSSVARRRVRQQLLGRRCPASEKKSLACFGKFFCKISCSVRYRLSLLSFPSLFSVQRERHGGINLLRNLLDSPPEASVRHCQAEEGNRRRTGSHFLTHPDLVESKRGRSVVIEKSSDLLEFSAASKTQLVIRYDS